MIYSNMVSIYLYMINKSVIKPLVSIFLGHCGYNSKTIRGKLPNNGDNLISNNCYLKVNKDDQ